MGGGFRFLWGGVGEFRYMESGGFRFRGEKVLGRFGKPFQRRLIEVNHSSFNHIYTTLYWNYSLYNNLTHIGMISKV